MPFALLPRYMFKSQIYIPYPSAKPDHLTERALVDRNSSLFEFSF